MWRNFMYWIRRLYALVSVNVAMCGCMYRIVRRRAVVEGVGKWIVGCIKLSLVKKGKDYKQSETERKQTSFFCFGRRPSSCEFDEEEVLKHAFGFVWVCRYVNTLYEYKFLNKDVLFSLITSQAMHNKLVGNWLP